MYEELIQQTTKAMQALSVQRKILSDELTGLLNRLQLTEAECKDAKIRVGELSSQKAALSWQNLALKSKLKQSREAIRAEPVLRAQFDEAKKRLEQSLADMQTEINTKSQRIGELERQLATSNSKAEETTKENTQLKEQIAELDKLYRTASDATIKAVKQIRQLDAQIEELRTQISTLTTEKEETSARNQELTSQIAVSTAQITALNKQITGLNGEVQRLTLSLQQKDGEIAEYAGKIVAFEDQVTDLELKKDEIEQNLKEEISELKANIKSLETKIQDHETSFSEASDLITQSLNNESAHIQHMRLDILARNAALQATTASGTTDDDAELEQLRREIQEFEAAFKTTDAASQSATASATTDGNTETTEVRQNTGAALATRNTATQGPAASTVTAAPNVTLLRRPPTLPRPPRRPTDTTQTSPATPGRTHSATGAQ